MIGAERRVAEMRYDSKGQRISSITHAATLDPALVGSTRADALATWANGLATKSKGIRTDYSYDVRGLLSSSTSYAALDDSGNGISDGGQSIVTYVYDQAGRLIKSMDAKKGSTSYAYDGAGRIIATRQPNEFSIRTEYNDVPVSRVIGGVTLLTTQSTSTQYNGLITVSTFDSEGKLVSVLERDASGAVIGETLYGYDDRGIPLWTEGPTGARSYTFYDGLKRKAADIDADGSYTEYVYNNQDQLTQLIRHAQPVNVAALAGSIPISSLSMQKLPRGAKAGDEVEYRGYDAAGRLVKSIDAGGYLTETSYDGQSRVTATIRYATQVTVSDPNKLPTADASSVDRINRRSYDKESRLRATLDAEGYLTEYNYDALGQLIETVAYAENRTNDRLPQGDAFREHRLYDGKGQLIATIDGDRYLTEMAYDANGQLIGKTRYAQSVSYTVGMRLADLRPASGERQTVSYDYNAMRQLSRETAADGTVTTHAYDLAGNRIGSTVAAASTDQRTVTRLYDVRALLLAELSGEGSAQLALATTSEQIKTVWNNYAKKYSYNAAGQRISMTDPTGNRTLYYYDRDGRLTHTINAAGEVEGRQYNVLNRLEQSTLYAKRIDPALLATLNGGKNDAAFASLLTGLASSDDASTRYFYDQRGLLTNQTDALGFTTSLHYNAFGQLDSRSNQIDKAGSFLAETMAYNRRGELTAAGADNSGQRVRTVTVYDAFGRVKQRSDANGKITETKYDGFGRQVIVKLPLGGSTTTTYDAFGRMLTQTDANGATTRTTYDTQQRSITLTTPEGVTQTVRNNRHGQQIGLTDGNGNTTTFEYNLDGKLLKTVNAAQESRSVYDNAGRLFQSVDANGNVTEYRYDAANRILSKTLDPTGLNLTTAYTYETRGQVQTVTDPRGIVTRNEYDKKGQLVAVTVDDNGKPLKTTFEYDGRGKTLKVTDPGLRAIRYEYDQLGRRTAEIVDPDKLALITAYTYDANGNVIARRDANQNLSRFSYDANNRLITQIDGAGAVTRFDYDAVGRLTHTFTYANALDLAKLEPQIPQPRSVGSDIVWLLQRVTADAARDRNTYTVYNKDGQTKYSIDGAGAVTQFGYDGNGNVTERIRYATPISLAGLKEVPTGDEITAALATVVGGTVLYSPAHRREVFGYDAANRLTISALALSKSNESTMWAVTLNEYDGNGNLTGTRSLQSPYRVQSSTIPKEKEVAAYCSNPQTASKLDAIKRFAYDHANRQIASATALGENESGVMQWAVTCQNYDGAGNVIIRIEYADTKPFSELPTGPNSTHSSSWMQALAGGGLRTRITRFYYDKANRQTSTIDSLGARTIREFDGSGNIVKTTRYAAAMTSMNGDTIVKDSSIDRVERAEYDGANRLRFTLDAEGYIHEKRYDGLGLVKSTFIYKQPVPNAASIEDAAKIQSGSVRGTSYTYDGHGNLASTTDALGETEYYVYDALNNKVSFTNKMRSQWTYAYDGAGHLLLETSPTVAVYSNTIPPSNPSWESYTNNTIALQTAFSYDALGNLLSRTEAKGTSQERTTSYRYDNAGRQIQTILPTASVCTEYPTQTPGVRSEIVVKDLTITTRYDALGNAVFSSDVSGNPSYKVYDTRGQVLYEVDAARGVTGYKRNAFGEVISLTRYANTLSASDPAPAVYTQASLEAILRQRANPADDRTIESQYDRLGRVVKVSEPLVWMYDQHSLSGNNTFQARRTTDTSYNAFGEVVVQKTYGADLEYKQLTRAAQTRFYYDARGNKRAQIQVLNDTAGASSAYLNTYVYDHAGNLDTQTEYSNAVGWNESGYDANSIRAAKEDRTVKYKYDAANRKESETRVGAHAGADAGSAAGDIVTTYGYDVLGNLTRTTDAEGHNSYTYYDALGRTIATARKPSASATAQNSQLTMLKLDAHGNAVARIEFAAGAPQNIDQSVPPTGSSSPRDRVTMTAFDANSRAMQTLDAEGKLINYSYDRHGRLQYQWRTVTDNANRVDTAYQITRYDALGRLLTVYKPGNVDLIRNTVGAPIIENYSYNAFGELGWRLLGAVGDGQLVEETRYDNAGRAWLSNSGDGVFKVSLFDARGNVTARVVSNAASVPNQPMGESPLLTLGGVDQLSRLGNLQRTTIRYNLLGQVVDAGSLQGDQLEFLQQNEDGSWAKVLRQSGQQPVDGLVVIGDRSDAGSRIQVRYRVIGSSNWILGEQRVTWVDGIPVFSTAGMASGRYEYRVSILPPGGSEFDSDGGVLEIAARESDAKAEQVLPMYLLLQNRAPDAGGFDYWVRRANSGSIMLTIGAEMLRNSIIARGSASARAFVEGMFADSLGIRPGSRSDYEQLVAGWSARLQAHWAALTDTSKPLDNSIGQILQDLLKENQAALANRLDVLRDYLILNKGNDPAMAQRLLAMADTDPAGAKRLGQEAAAKELRQVQIARLYIALYGRAADKGGLQFWVESGKPLDAIADQFLTMNEWRALLPDVGQTSAQYNEQLINRVYSSLVGHRPSAAELQGWQQKLDSGQFSRGTFINKLIEEKTSYTGNDTTLLAERKAIFDKVAITMAYVSMPQPSTDTPTLIEIGRVLLGSLNDNAGVTSAAQRVLLAIQAQQRAAPSYAAAMRLSEAERPLEEKRLRLARLYVTLLNRAADAGGFNFWLDALENNRASFASIGEQMLLGEGGRNYPSGLSDDEFVKAIYRNAFGQEIDGLQLNTWKARLATQSRGQLASELVESVLTGSAASEATARALFNNKAALSLTYAQNMQLNDLDLARKVLVTVATAGLTAAINEAYAPSLQLAEAVARDNAAAAQKAAALMAQALTAADALRSATLSVEQQQQLQRQYPMASPLLRAAKLYVALLNRGSGVGLDAAGLISLAQGLLAKGGSNPTDANASVLDFAEAQNMLDSPEGKLVIPPADRTPLAFVKKMYLQAQGRANPDAGGLQFWTNAATAYQTTYGATWMGRIAVEMLDSFLYAPIKDGPGMVDNLNGRVAFQNRLGTALEAVQRHVSDVVAQANTGARLAGELAQANANAANAAQAAAAARQAEAGTNAGAALDIARLYVGVLNRSANGTPLESGFFFHFKNLLNGQQSLAGIANDFINSTEGRRLYEGTSNAAFLDKLYLQILGRRREPYRDDYWLNDLNQGYSRGQVAASIIRSLTSETYNLASEFECKAWFDQRVQDAVQQFNGSAAFQLGLQEAANVESAARVALRTANDNYRAAQDTYIQLRNQGVYGAPAVVRAQRASAFESSANRHRLHQVLVAFQMSTDYDTVQRYLADLDAGNTSLARIVASALPGFTNKADFYLNLYTTILGRNPYNQSPPDLGINWWINNNNPTVYTYTDYAINFALGCIDNELTSGNAWRVRRDFAGEVSRAEEPNRSLARALAANYAQAVEDASQAIRTAAGACEAAELTVRLRSQDVANAERDNRHAGSLGTAFAGVGRIQTAAVLAAKAKAAALYKGVELSNYAKSIDPNAVSWTQVEWRNFANQAENAGNAIPTDVQLSQRLAELARANLLVAASAQANANPDTTTRRILKLGQMYVLLMGRAPTAVEINAAMYQLNTYLDQSQPDLAQRDEKALALVARNLIESLLSLYGPGVSNTDFIKRLFRNGTDRELSGGGLQYWEETLTRPVDRFTRADLVVGLMFSLTKGTLNDDTSAFARKVNAVMQDIQRDLQSAANTGSLATYLGGIALALRQQAIHAGGDATSRMTADAKYATEITQLYVTLLGRTPEPSALISAILQRKGGTPAAQIVRSILESEEIQSRLPSSLGNADFVGKLIKIGMNRDAAPAEVAELSNQLASGLKREDLVSRLIGEVYAYAGGDAARLAAQSWFIGRVDTALNALATTMSSYNAAFTTSFLEGIQAQLSAAFGRYVDAARGVDSITVSSSRVSAGPDKLKLDRWGNVLSRIDARNARWVTNYSYTADNQVASISLQNTGNGADYYKDFWYDKLAHLTTQREGLNAATIAAGHINKLEYDANGQVSKEIHADGGVVTYELDNFGQRTQMRQSLRDGTSRVSNYKYDRLGRQTERTIESVKVYGWDGSSNQETVASGTFIDRYTYDELGRRIASRTDNQGVWGGGATTLLRYDLSGNIVESSDGFNSTFFAYDGRNHKTAERYRNDIAKTWAVDRFGRTLQYTDLGGNTASYDYNASGQLIHIASEVTMEAGQPKKRQDIYYRYDDGSAQLTQITDTALGQFTYYSYDRAGNRVSERVWLRNEGRYIQDQSLSYDAQSRLATITARVRNADYHLSYVYDAYGNRSNVTTSYHPAAGLGKTIKVEYRFDAMNRQTYVAGTVETTSSKSADGQDRLQAYKRIMDEEEATPEAPSWSNDFTPTITAHNISYDWDGSRLSDNDESYSYDAAGHLSDIRKNNVLIGYRHYDAAGRTVATLDNGKVRLSRYDAIGRLDRQRTLNENRTTTFNTVDYKYHEASGQLESYTLSDAAGKVQQITSNVYGTLRGSYLLTDTVVRNTANGDSRSSVQKYDINGNLSQVFMNGETRELLSDAYGHILEKQETAAGQSMPFVTRSLIANGEILGSSSTSSETFSSVHESLSGTDTQSNPTVYVVQRDGENLGNIAKAVWGDERLWYMIAQANGLTGNEPLKAGQPLTIPVRLSTIYNGANTFKPYNAGELVGSTTPELAIPQPAAPAPKKGKCGGVGQLIMVAVAVVATVLSAGAAASSLAAAGSATATASAAAAAGAVAAGTAAGLTTSMAFVAGAIGGAVGSIASQAVGIALGMQDKFSWKGVALSALGGGASAGVASLGAGGSLGVAFAGSETPALVARAALGSVASQAIGNAVGLQSGFNWRNVAVAAAGAGVGAATSRALGEARAFANLGTFADLARGTVSGLAAGAAGAIARGGKIEIARIATDAFGNALGSSLVENFNDSARRNQLAEDQMRSGREEAQIEKDAWGARGASSSTSTGSVMTADEIKRRVMLDILGEEAREDSLLTPEMLQTGGPVRGAARYRPGSFEMVKNNNWDNAMNIASDPFGLVGEVPGIIDELARMSQAKAKNQVDAMRKAIIKAGVKNVPTDYEYYISNSGSGIDFRGTAERLGNVYESHVRDQRLRETWGDDYESIRVGKSKMTVLEFEKRVLDVHLQATNRAYGKGVDLIANGELAVKDGQYARTLGSFIDDQVRLRLRDMAKAEGINDSSISNIWAINRRIKNDLVEGYGIPDGRIGFNIFHDTTLARKDGYTPQLSKWNAIRPGNFLIIRPTELGGPYVVPRQSIQPYVPMPKLPGRKF
ncbi:DUF4214 domain-containing protein [Massilia sp. BJB1822]|uniref:DUF4214 domain-containing protein n=1 Tax=Massilia sp. BJB1822 TaxID=2744470 RepID=UPI001C3CDDDD